MRILGRSTTTWMLGIVICWCCCQCQQYVVEGTTTTGSSSNTNNDNVPASSSTSHSQPRHDTANEEESDDDNDDTGLSPHEERKLELRVEIDTNSLMGDANTAASYVVEHLTQDLTTRISHLFEKTKTPECRALISEHFGYYLQAIGKEKSLPFSDLKFTNQCEGDTEYDFDNLPEGMHLGHIQARTYKPPPNETEYITSGEIVLLYGILAHDSAAATIRLIQAVDEPTTKFIVHVDAKYEDTYQTLVEYAKDKPKVHILGEEHRVRVNWGGFSMVNATLQMLNYADTQVPDFTHFVHMASTCYPIASNRRIRNTLASFPKDANFLHVILKPTRPAKGDVWNYFVECDDRLHRIYQLQPLLKETSGVHLHTASQWFIISKEFAHYLANPEPDTFLYQFLDYIPHVVIADETFFGTVLRNTPFCHKHHNWNFVHLQFDRWENERAVELRDERKCVMPDPNHCGRSPTTMTLDYLDILELSEDLFARKFMDEDDSKIKNIIDTIRTKEEFVLTSLNATEPIEDGKRKVELRFVGHGVMFVAKDTLNDEQPLCLGLGETQNKIRIVPCFKDWVRKTLAEEWETGAVIMEETLPHNRWEIGPCSSDGSLERLESGQINVTSGFYTPTGPRCMVRLMDGIRKGRCLDGESLDAQPGGQVHVYPCTKRWHQFVSFGNGREVPFGTIHTTIPLHTRRRIGETGRVQEAYMCLGVTGRGDKDETDWLGERSKTEEEEEASRHQSIEDRVDSDTFSVDEDESPHDEEILGEDGLLPLRHWQGEQLVATRCSNSGAVIEWVVVPFIEEDEIDEPEEEQGNSTNKSDDEEEEEEEL